ncbi:EamA domain-containing membrane protein RarD [Orbus hercynius]|uniref:EamA domain-containing membrane protein RarD n=1 Tax=Orbus hercynius TaxID=593135 RepID=A0A495RE78_9GAMM|nr:DMT family transporter [Orbus hercynius]RKS85783.1 EamA domain-containing membrane protein RarD [Orbus hercynius]
MIKQQNVKLGFLLAMITAIMWGVVPIAMKYALQAVDPYTLVWYRFMISAIGLTLWLAYKKQFPRFSIFKKRRRLLMLAVAVLGLLGNFVLFASGVKYLSATTSQVVAQLGIVIFMISSAIVFNERLRPSQIIGISVLIIGLLLFFNKNLIDLFANLSEYGLGVLLTSIAAASWALYALAQKALLQKLRAEQLLWLIYVTCAVLLLFIASPMKIMSANPWQIFAIIFCGLNTIIGYGALVAAMERWQAAQVSAITTLTPLFSLIFADLFALIWPENFVMQYLNILGYIGAFAVVCGAMFATIGHKIWHQRKGFLFNRKKGEKR